MTANEPGAAAAPRSLKRLSSVPLALPGPGRLWRGLFLRPEPQRLEPEADPAAPRITVEIADAPRFAALGAAFDDLCARAAAPNPFMHPAAALPIAATARTAALLAWDGQARLVGVFFGILERSRVTWPFEGFVSPVSPLANLGSPVIDRDLVEPVLRAFLVTLKHRGDLPGLVEIGDLNACLLEPLRRAADAEDGRVAITERRCRARLLPAPDGPAFWSSTVSGQHRREQQRQRRRLADSGRLDFVVARTPCEIAASVEDFLALEAAGWKGARGSAVASDRAVALFFRAYLRDMALAGLVETHALKLDDRPLAVSVSLHAGRRAFTWRIAFDESFRKSSPGLLLFENITLRYLADGAIEEVDSCNHRDAGFQATRWPARHGMVDVLVDLRAKPLWPVASALALRERWRRLLRARAGHWVRRARALRRRLRRKAASGARG
ncbi:GNAT family N-acetyltransferase [Aurantimonas sp. Leaf443]|uniref:GNAT family N-acetyltransferase n=1 Tax=Aurantimonas sp. Leaf443 TaxID=1736378 RepID=UPI0006FD934F|nr:GNAT family N-acetyltransferase [Aurantimonas sp. Leaf443]KQT88377.1 hypothetical protein ASG48_02850 [Aurantimonas sp. Leaf443]